MGFGQVVSCCVSFVAMLSIRKLSNSTKDEEMHENCLQARLVCRLEEVAQGMDYLHSRGIMHSDLKVTPTSGMLHQLHQAALWEYFLALALALLAVKSLSCMQMCEKCVKLCMPCLV
jgi:serine/threonine protein kinase